MQGLNQALKIGPCTHTFWLKKLERAERPFGPSSPWALSPAEPPGSLWLDFGRVWPGWGSLLQPKIRFTIMNATINPDRALGHLGD